MNWFAITQGLTLIGMCIGFMLMTNDIGSQYVYQGEHELDKTVICDLILYDDVRDDRFEIVDEIDGLATVSYRITTKADLPYLQKVGTVSDGVAMKFLDVFLILVGIGGIFLVIGGVIGTSSGIRIFD